MRAVHPLEHAVDRVRELGDFRVARRAGEPCAQLRRADGARLGGDALERAQRAGDRLTGAARDGEPGAGEQQRRRGGQRAQRDDVRFPARHDVDVERTRRAVQHAVAPARPLGDRGEQHAAHVVRRGARRQALETPGGHVGRHEIDVLFPTDAGGRACDDHLAPHGDEPVRERGGHDAPGLAGRVAVGAEQRLGEVGRVLERAPQRHFRGPGEQRDYEQRVPRQPGPGDAREPPPEDCTQPEFVHVAASLSSRYPTPRTVRIGAVRVPKLSFLRR